MRQISDLTYVTANWCEVAWVDYKHSLSYDRKSKEKVKNAHEQRRGLSRKPLLRFCLPALFTRVFTRIFERKKESPAWGDQSADWLCLLTWLFVVKFPGWCKIGWLYDVTAKQSYVTRQRHQSGTLLSGLSVVLRQHAVAFRWLGSSVASLPRIWLNSVKQCDIFTGFTSCRFCSWRETLRNGVVILLKFSKETLDVDINAYQVIIHISIFVEQELLVGFAGLLNQISFCRVQLQDLRTKILLISFLNTM